ncbi:MAG: hypothetical protein HY326_06240 [Chloroflexi bacterium]|nr:hypothetical protein [Chloroflexota bacterium]
MKSKIFGLMVLAVTGAVAGMPATAPPIRPSLPAPRQSGEAQSRVVYLPLVSQSRAGNICAPVPNVNYSSLPPNPPPTDRPAESHADLNLALRGYAVTGGYKGLVDYGGSGDPNAPQLPGLFSDQRTAVFQALYQVHDWNWSCNCQGPLLTYPDVTLAGLDTTPGEILHLPPSGYTIGSGFQALVLYATTHRITLKYTREDNVIYGYTLHLENLCVDPQLLALYQSLNAAGRHQLPALAGGQPIGRAAGSQVGVAIRDTGTFMDPRARNSWWRGR